MQQFPFCVFGFRFWSFVQGRQTTLFWRHLDSQAHSTRFYRCFDVFSGRSTRLYDGVYHAELFCCMPGSFEGIEWTNEEMAATRSCLEDAAAWMKQRCGWGCSFPHENSQGEVMGGPTLPTVLECDFYSCFFLLILSDGWYHQRSLWLVGFWIRGWVL